MFSLIAVFLTAVWLVFGFFSLRFIAFVAGRKIRVLGSEYQPTKFLIGIIVSPIALLIVLAGAVICRMQGIPYTRYFAYVRIESEKSYLE